jgi:N-acetylglucosamine malate deacetylase 1
MQNLLVVAPHPDDETLGCGGTLLRYKSEGARIGWLIVTSVSEQHGWTSQRVQERRQEIDRVRALLGFDSVYELGLPSTRLDSVPMSEIVERIGGVFRDFVPGQVFVPHRSDVHTDHRIVFDAVAACTKWFRYPSVRSVLAYETLSETDFALSAHHAFRPNYFVDIGPFIELKLQVMSSYASELGQHPFPRSLQALRAQATLRGAECGCEAAEAFELLRARL